MTVAKFIVVEGTGDPKLDGLWLNAPTPNYSLHATPTPDTKTFEPLDWYERREDGEYAEICVP